MFRFCLIYFNNTEIKLDIREVKHDVYGKRQTVKMKILPSLFSCVNSRVKLFLFAMNSRRKYSIFVCFIYGLEEKNSKSEVIFAVCRLPSAVNVMLNLSIIRQTANASLPFILLPFYRILKLIPHKNREKIPHSQQTKNDSFPRTNAKRQTAEVEFLPFAGKINVMLNLSNVTLPEVNAV